MIDFMVFMRKYGVYFGAVFTALVVASLVYLHLFAQPVVPELAEPSSSTPDLIRCKGEVEWVDRYVPRVVAYWEARGRTIDEFRVEACSKVCDWNSPSGEVRKVPCEPGHIVVALRDHWFSEEHAGQLVWVKNVSTGKFEWATILLPAIIESTTDLDDPRALPKDAGPLILAHEVGHWFGLDHVFTPFIGPLYSVPTGHVMNPNAFDLGWDDDGIKP